MNARSIAAWIGVAVGVSLAAGCDGDSLGPSGGGEAGAPSLAGAAGASALSLPTTPVRFVFQVTPEFEREWELQPSEWLVTADLRSEGDSLQAWFAGSGRIDSQTTRRVTRGSTAATGALVDGAYVFDDFELVLGEPYELGEVISLTTLELFAGDAGELRGTAGGEWHGSHWGDDQLYTSPFTATLLGSPDDEAPQALSTDLLRTLLPFDRVRVIPSEPLSEQALPTLIATSAAGAVSVTVVPVADERPGFVRELWLEAPGLWPAGQDVGLRLDGLTDAAGNRADVELGTASFFERPDTDSNLDFEAELAGWISPTDAVRAETVNAAYVEGADPTNGEIAAPQGSRMAHLPVGAKLVGSLAPPPGAAQLCFSAAVVADDDPGFTLEFVYPASTTLIDFGPDSVEAFTSLSWGDWSGFVELCAELPSNAPEEYWLVVSAREFQMFGFLSELFVDDFHYVSP